MDTEMYELVKDTNRRDIIQLLYDTPGHYQEHSSLWNYIGLDKRPIFAAAYDYYDIDFKGKTVMDIGPGEGASLDEAMARGAKECHFIDRDGIITRWCELKGYTKNFWDFKDFERSLAMEEKYDVVIARGSFNADELFHEDRVAEWVTKISKGHTIITPTWDRGEEFAGLYHCCLAEHLERHFESPFHMGFINRDYKEDCIEGYNEPLLRFPITYYKKHTR